MTPGEVHSADDELGLADEAMAEFQALRDMESRRGAISRLYYAVFHAARAALRVRGRYAKTHKGQMLVFNSEFAPAPILEQLLRSRGEADYGTKPFTMAAGEIDQAATDAAAFIADCRRIVAEARAVGPDEPDPPPDI